MHWIVETVRHFLVAWGYWAVVLGLLAEDAGLPLPGETILIFAAFLSYRNHQLSLWWIILAGIAAATAGDNIGYWVGRKGGRKLVEAHRKVFRLKRETLNDGEKLMQKHGEKTIFFARWIWGMRTLAGPVAGTLKMRWERFFLWNFLGACTWVTAIALIGFAFGSHFHTLLAFFKKVDIAVMSGVAAVSIFLWIRYKKRRKRRHQREAQQQAAEKADKIA